MGSWLMIYLVVSAIIVLLVLVVATIDIIVSVRDSKQERIKVVEVPVEKIVEKVVEVPVEVKGSEEVIYSIPKKDQKNEVIGESGIKFSNIKTLNEKFKLLQPDSKERYTTVYKYLSNIENVKKIENDRYVEFKFGRTRIARLSIKRDIPYCECFVISKEFTDAIRDYKASVKAAGPIIKIKTNLDVEAIISIVDASVSTYNEDIKEKRRVKA